MIQALILVIIGYFIALILIGSFGKLIKTLAFEKKLKHKTAKRLLILDMALMYLYALFAGVYFFSHIDTAIGSILMVVWALIAIAAFFNNDYSRDAEHTLSLKDKL